MHCQVWGQLLRRGPPPRSSVASLDYTLFLGGGGADNHSATPPQMPKKNGGKRIAGGEKKMAASFPQPPCGCLKNGGHSPAPLRKGGTVTRFWVFLDTNEDVCLSGFRIISDTSAFSLDRFCTPLTIFNTFSSRIGVTKT